MSDIPKDIVVGSKSGRLTSGVFKRNGSGARMPRMVIYIVILVLVVAVAVFAWHWYAQHRSAQKTAEQQTKTRLISQAARVLNPQDSAKLKPIVAQIENQPTHNQDTDYLYVLTTYYVNISDRQTAAKDLAALKATYKPSVGYAAPLRPVATWMTIDQLQARLSDQQNPKTQTKPAGFGG